MKSGNKIKVLGILLGVLTMMGCNRNLSRTRSSTAVKPAVCQNLATPVVASTTCAATFKSIETQIGGRTNLEVEEAITKDILLEIHLDVGEAITKDILLEPHLDVGEAITKDIVAAPQPLALFGSLDMITVIGTQLPGLTGDFEEEEEKHEEEVPPVEEAEVVIPGPALGEVELNQVMSKHAGDELPQSMDLLDEEPKSETEEDKAEEKHEEAEHADSSSGLTAERKEALIKTPSAFLLILKDNRFLPDEERIFLEELLEDRQRLNRDRRWPFPTDEAEEAPPVVSEDPPVVSPLVEPAAAPPTKLTWERKKVIRRMRPEELLAMSVDTDGILSPEERACARDRLNELDRILDTYHQERAAAKVQIDRQAVLKAQKEAAYKAERIAAWKAIEASEPERREEARIAAEKFYEDLRIQKEQEKREQEKSGGSCNVY